MIPQRFRRVVHVEDFLCELLKRETGFEEREEVAKQVGFNIGRFNFPKNMAFHESEKYLYGCQSYVFEIDGCAVLRLAGDGNTSRLMTATTGEYSNDNLFKPTIALLQAADIAAQLLSLKILDACDWKDREFSVICELDYFRMGDGESDGDLLRVLFLFAFVLLNLEQVDWGDVSPLENLGLKVRDAKGLWKGDKKTTFREEMRELYDAINPGFDGDVPYGGEVYLQDGVWLRPDGTMYER